MPRQFDVYHLLGGPEHDAKRLGTVEAKSMQMRYWPPRMKFPDVPRGELAVGELDSDGSDAT